MQESTFGFGPVGQLRLRRFWRTGAAALAVACTAFAFSAPADLTRGLAWLQAQVRADGNLQAAGSAASGQQAQCETALTLQRLAASSPQLAALLANLRPSGNDATESIACWQLLRQQLGQPGTDADTERRRVQSQGYAAYEGIGVAAAVDTGWALSARLQNLAAADKASLLAWLQTSQAADGSFATAGRPDLVATAAILRGLKDEVGKSSIAAGIASRATQWLLARRAASGTWSDDVAVTSLLFEAVHPYSGADPAIASGVESYLLAQQRPDGSWQGDPYVTAVALRALALTAVTPVDPILASAGTVRGVVTVAATGEPLAGVTVQAQPGTGPARSAVTDATGKYLLQGITPGTSSVTASLAGYETLGAQVTLPAGGVALFSPGMFPAGTPPPTGARIKGVVQAFGSGAPLAGVNVQLAGPAAGSTTTNALGAFDV
ncbi:MAG TPA: carboxypeptidase regulatory-like domain-containing protein, partial [Ramlibacter sp.]